MRVTFDTTDEEPADDGWQPSLFGGPGAESVLKQAGLFGRLDGARKSVDLEREDQPRLFE